MTLIQICIAAGVVFIADCIIRALLKPTVVGVLEISENEEKVLYGLVITKPMDTIQNEKYITFKVRR